MFGLGMPEILLILLIALLLFGAEKLPGIGRALGKAVREFKSGMDNLSHHKDEDGRKDDQPDG
ncbi:MAG: twin-arginine translocase TatA/TatE family subunit [Candidatus Omnitrophota bacterium]